MAARKDNHHTQTVRDRIQTTQLLTRLQNNALGKLKKQMTTGQIQSTRIVLAKAVPDLKQTELTGQEGGPLTIKVINYAGTPDSDN